MDKTKNIILVSIIVIFIIAIIGGIFYGTKLTKKPAPIDEKKSPPSGSIEIKKSERVYDKEKIKEEISCIEVKEGFNFKDIKDIRTAIDFFINKGIVYDLMDQKVFEYKIGQGRFELSKIEMDMEGLEKLRVIKVYNKNQEIMKVETKITGWLWCFSFKDNRYVILITSAGGAHGLISNFIFLITPSNELKPIKEIRFTEKSSMDVHPILPSFLLFKGNKLYIKVGGYIEGYYFGAYVYGFPVELYYLIHGPQISLAIAEFKEEYLKKAEEKSKECLDSGNLPDAGEAVINYLLAGEEEKAWKVAKKFFDKFPNIIINELTGEEMTLENFKEIIKTIYKGLMEG
jgi:hypothetical protein